LYELHEWGLITRIDQVSGDELGPLYNRKDENVQKGGLSP